MLKQNWMIVNDFIFFNLCDRLLKSGHMENCKQDSNHVSKGSKAFLS